MGVLITGLGQITSVFSFIIHVFNNSGTDKLGMDIFSQLEQVFRNEVSNNFHKKYVPNIRTIIFQFFHIIKLNRDMPH